ncbi:hypothetical protein N7463_009610 [Penicillium fimorum]|uniref:Uncharacterized protein n=1 Tax=Penicillium fimorum TaxID=1882269 RepID=A0A9X0C0I9_9EURO|nr:hypothetical protein N7463_009610 [Penicillium fimorum]
MDQDARRLQANLLSPTPGNIQPETPGNYTRSTPSPGDISTPTGQRDGVNAMMGAVEEERPSQAQPGSCAKLELRSTGESHHLTEDLRFLIWLFLQV